MLNVKRLLIAAGLGIAIYALAVAAGGLLYVSGAIGTGAMHNDCEGIREDLADELGVPEEDVEQEMLKQETIECLEAHELEEDDALRRQFLTWPVWPAIVVGLVYIVWPSWARLLVRQERLSEGPHEEEEG